MIVKIKRQDEPDSKPYWQSFDCEISKNATVASLLDFINFNDDPTDTDGNIVRRIRWECNCLQKMCGACAMLINGKAALACDTFIKDLTEPIVLEPLSKFPVVADLIVDRSIIHENLSHLYLERNAITKKKEYDHQYLAAKCLKCGLCLEVCPNYVKGTDFYGAMYANESYLTASQSSEERQKTVRKAYNENFSFGCSKSLACAEVCPIKIPMLSSMAKLNRHKI